MWLFRKVRESLRSIWEAKVINFSLLFLPASRSLTFFLIVCSIKDRTVSRPFTFCRFFLKVILTDYFTHFFLFFFLQPCELKRGVQRLLLSAGFLFTPLCPDSLQTLQFTLCGKQDRTLSVTAFCPAGTGTDQWPRPTQQAQQTQATEPHLSANSVWSIKKETICRPTRFVSSNELFCNQQAVKGHTLFQTLKTFIKTFTLCLALPTNAWLFFSDT